RRCIAMKPSTKFALGAAVILGSVTLLIVEGVKQTGTYFLTPTQLVERTQQDPSFHDVGLKVAAKVVKGSIHRDDAASRVDFRISDGTHEFPVTYVGIVPDTFTDENDIDVVVEGKFDRNNVFQATDVIAKCGSRYEAAWDEQAPTST
ncbi:MAG: cytochrome c maturation protein CcmE, partial [Gemmatimonadetes bacterium]|nr:cytochrome c maturation protein CcmE [Gemmatimonadota bacterium]